MDQLFLLAKYKIVKLWSKNEKKKGKFRPKMKKMRCHEKMKKKEEQKWKWTGCFYKKLKLSISLHQYSKV